MSEWNLKNQNTVEHLSGYKLTLNSGSWENPEDIRPWIPSDLKLSPLEIARLLRKGLQFACTIPYPETER